jgi:hypothetical protein
MNNLEKAKRDYPKGTVFKSAYNYATRTSSGIFIIEDDNSITSEDNWIFCEGKWAEVITRPEVKIKDMVKGEVYAVLIDDLRKWVIQFDNIVNNCDVWTFKNCEISAKFIHTNSLFAITTNIKSIHLANAEEYELLMGKDEPKDETLSDNAVKLPHIVEVKTPNRITAEAIVHLKSLGYKILKPTFEEI